MGRQEVDIWRDEWTLIAATTLNEITYKLGADIDKAIAAASHRNLYVSRAHS